MKTMKLKSLALAAVAGALALGSVACSPGGGGSSYDPYWRSWYDVYGNYCYTGYPAPGCNFYYDGSKIMDFEDPYYDTYNYNLEYGTWEYVDSYGYLRNWTGWAWLSPNGILYDDYGFALNEKEKKQGRDLIGEYAAAEEQKILEVGAAFAETHGMAESKGVEIARALNDYATLGKKNGRTDAELAKITERLFGVSVKEALPALAKAKAGDLSALQELNKDVASHWGVDPEGSKEILKGWFSREIAKHTK